MSRSVRRNETLRRLLYPAAVALLLLSAWQLGVTLWQLPPYVLPSPLRVLQALAADWGLLGPALWVTLRVTLLAFALATATGVLVSFAFVQSRALETALFPYAVLLQVTPIVAIAPLLILWVRDVDLAMVLCAALVALFPVIANTSLGLRSVDPDLLDYFRLQRATRWQLLLRLRVPSALPYFFGGLRICSGLALIGAVVAEFVAGTGGTGSGLAYQILLAGYQLDVPRMFAALLLIGLAGIALFATMTLLARTVLGPWHASERSAP
jgi:NitT/TauT family transport system permease protein